MGRYGKPPSYRQGLVTLVTVSHPSLWKWDPLCCHRKAAHQVGQQSTLVLSLQPGCAQLGLLPICWNRAQGLPLPAAERLKAQLLPPAATSIGFSEVLPPVSLSRGFWRNLSCPCMIDPRQQKGAKLLSHPFPNPRLTGFLRDLVGVMGRKTIIKSVSFRKVCAAMQNIYNTDRPGSELQHQTCNCPGCLIASLVPGSVLQLLLINPLHDGVQGFYFNDSLLQRQLPREQYGFGEPSTWDRTPIIIKKIHHEGN